MSSIPSDELSLAQQAALLLGRHHSGTLSTFSVKHAGFPFVSLANYSVDRKGQPVFFFSSMASHSKNLRANPKAALLVAGVSEQSGGDLAKGRLTLMGTVVPIAGDASEASEIRDGYLEANPDAQQWISFGDFQFYRLELIDLYFVGGFGTMGWITPEEFASGINFRS